MKFIIFLSAILFLNFSHAADETVSCTIYQSDLESIDHCVQKSKDGSFKILKSALTKIKFDAQGLAGGSIHKNGCYWFNKEGLLRKTLCFDNGPDFFKEGLTRFIDARGTFGFMDKKLQIKIPSQYTFSFPFENGYAKVCMNCKEEKIDNEHFIMVGGEWSIIDKSGKVVKICAGATKEHECLLHKSSNPLPKIKNKSQNNADKRSHNI